MTVVEDADVPADRLGPPADAHLPVLAAEALAALEPDPAGRYVDATYGRGGHAALVLAELGPRGRLLALDRDPAAEADARRRFADDARFDFARANFDALREVVAAAGWNGAVDGLLADLGVSSPQLDDAARGFSFSRDGALDMRMDPATGESAADWLARVDAAELAQVLKRFGEERYAPRIARAIVAAGAEARIEGTARLAEIVKAAHPRWERHHHPATRTFQAIRIHVNDELGALERLLAAAASVLRSGGRIAVISFHSLEDRLVKRALRIPPPDPRLPRGLPPPNEPSGRPADRPGGGRDGHPWRTIGKAIKASAAETARNPRARSAVLRVAERT